MKLTRRSWVISLSAFAATGAMRPANAADVQSGVQVGDFPSPFDVLDVTGPNKGNTLCYR